MPLISVLITACNTEKYIGRAIRSALNQSLPKNVYEIIVVNDCSTDRTRFALEVFEDDIRLVNNDRQIGLPASLNKGIRRSKAQYITRIDGDDYVHEDYLKVLSLYLTLNEDLDAVACDYLMVDDKEHVLARKNCIEEPIACGMMLRMEQLIDIGLYDENFLAREDEDLRIRFLQKYQIDRIRLPLYRYRRHENNLTNDVRKMGIYNRMLKNKHNLDA